MFVTSIKLSRSWRLGKKLDSGGFGIVHEAEAEDGMETVVKLIPKEPGASRELLFENLSGSPNIIPVLDSGEWENYFVLVMPQAEKSLRKHLEEAGGSLDVDEAIEVLADIAEALASLEASVVHRDLKPENVLLYNGHWCLADFGIARYAEATTAPDTRKYAMTPTYAAPEQWRGDRATHATDIYAFGVMAFELLRGSPPFIGPDFRGQHLDEPPPTLHDCPSWLASLVEECLFKSPGARPLATNILARIKAGKKSVSPSMKRLQEIQKLVVEEQGVEAARMSAQMGKAESRKELYQAAKQTLERIKAELRRYALEAAPATRVSSSADQLVLELGKGALVIDPVKSAPPDCLAVHDYTPAFDVIAFTAIAARKQCDQYGYEGRAHSLWYCDAHDEGVYRWFELAFMIMPGIAERSKLDPFALPPTDEEAATAFTPVMGIRQIAWKPTPFDQGEEGNFIDRWLGWFAAAADGRLSHPTTLPENSGGNYRTPVRR